MSLDELLKDNWDKSSFMKISLNETLRTQIENETKFLDLYYDKIPLRTRAYVILNRIDQYSLPKCKCQCQRLCAIDKTYPERGFRLYATPECSRSNKTIDKEAKAKLEDYDWIYDQRIIQKKSIEQIALDLNVSTLPVSQYLKKHKLNELIDCRQRNTRAISILSDSLALENLYNSGMSCENIAKKLATSKATVSRWLKTHHIEPRDSNSYERKNKRISQEEQTLYEYVTKIYDGEVIQSNRSILKGKELDIYIPEKNIAIEYNGLYSHYYRPYESTESRIKGKDYHLKKTLVCKELGIQLLQFYSDEWLLKRNIIESVIASKLNLNSKLYARKCIIEEIGTHEKNKFLNENHVQGEDKSRIKLGLKYDNELVCIMTFCKSRFNNDYEWELSRFACRMGLNVVGGFSRLLKYFRSNHSGSIISYADRRYSDGGVYYKNGFELIRTNSPSYYYVDGNYLIRHHRMKFQKKLIGAGNLTEYERAVEMGFNKIYDCGTLTFGLQ